MLQEIQAHGPESLEKQLQFNGLPFVLSTYHKMRTKHAVFRAGKDTDGTWPVLA